MPTPAAPPAGAAAPVVLACQVSRSKYQKRDPRADAPAAFCWRRRNLRSRKRDLVASVVRSRRARADGLCSCGAAEVGQERWLQQLAGRQSGGVCSVTGCVLAPRRIPSSAHSPAGREGRGHLLVLQQGSRVPEAAACRITARLCCQRRHAVLLTGGLVTAPECTAVPCLPPHHRCAPEGRPRRFFRSAAAAFLHHWPRCVRAPVLPVLVTHAFHGAQAQRALCPEAVASTMPPSSCIWCATAEAWWQPDVARRSVLA